MKLKEKDFIEIEFTGRVKDGEIFDSNMAEDLKKIKSEATSKPFAFCLGQGMFLKGMEDFLVGKDIGEYEVELKPDQAFGARDSKLIQMIPMKVFREQKINPVPGIMFNFDNRLAKILTVSGGRIMVDFNNPVAGKDVIYKIKVLRKIEKQDEKIKALNEFLFRKEFKFEIKEKKVILEVEKQMTQFVELFKDKFKEILGLDLEVKEEGEKKEKKVSKEVGEVVEDVKKEVEEKTPQSPQ